jgi:hypothetical protein
MKPASSFLLGLALMGLYVAAQSQTIPKSKTQPMKPMPRTKGTAAQKRTAYAPPFTTDTAAFRRSGRPADAVPNRIR